MVEKDKPVEQRNSNVLPVTGEHHQRRKPDRLKESYMNTFTLNRIAHWAMLSRVHTEGLKEYTQNN